MRTMLVAILVVILAVGIQAIAQDSVDPVKLQAENKALRATIAQLALQIDKLQAANKSKDAQIEVLLTATELLRSELLEAKRVTDLAKTAAPPSAIKPGEQNPYVAYAENYRTAQKAQGGIATTPNLDLPGGTATVGRLSGSFRVMQIISSNACIVNPVGAEYSVRVDGMSTSNLADDQKIVFHPSLVFASEGTWSYTTVLGAKRTIFRVKVISSKLLYEVLDGKQP